MSNEQSTVDVPDFMYHGTDGLTGLYAVRGGFEKDLPDYLEHTRSRYAELGFLHGTQEMAWARAYAKARARNWRQKQGAVLRIDLRGLPVEDDPTVALDGMPARAFRVPTPIPAERIALAEEVPVA